MMFAWLFSKPLPVSSQAPDFSVLDDSGATVTLSALRGRNVVLVFYPGDDTPTCTKQLCEFRDRWDQLNERNVVVYGVNPRGVASHQHFREKFKFPFPLLIDKGQKVGELYKASGLIVKRTVYLIGPDGVIRYAQSGKPAPEDVLACAQ
jgi:peroxiredoxin Q/BCP